MSFISENWLLLLFVAILLYLFIQAQVENNRYKQDVVGFKEKIKDLQEQIDIDVHVIDSLSKIDTVFIKEIEVIKEEADEKIKLVDTMSVSNMQSFYTKRYQD